MNNQVFDCKLFAKQLPADGGARVKRGMSMKAASGVYPGRPPLGYNNSNRQIVLDPVRASLIREARELDAAGTSPKEIL